MKAIIRYTKRIAPFWIKVSPVTLTCLLFLIFPSCQKYEGDFPPNESFKMQNSILISPMTVNSSDGGMSILFGPKVFKRSYGMPVTERQNIENPDFNCFDGNFILKIQNGNNLRTRVSSAEIRIDGVLVTGPSDFSKNVSFITKSLSGITSESILEVKLTSAPGSFIDLWIEGTSTAITPLFEQIGPICQNSTAPALPLSSNNSPAITGSWDPATINTGAVGTTRYTFIPEEGQCATVAIMDIEILTSIIPTFAQIGPLLERSAAPELPATSTNGITGTWSPGTISTETTGVFIFNFTPNNGQCASTTTMDIEVTNKATVTDIDGNPYNTVLIGDQWWMTENLKTTKYNNGDLIGTTNPATLDISGEIEPKYQWASGGNEINVPVYGRLYTWYAITDNRNVCPAGWHVPNDAEWTKLTNYLTNNGYGYEGSGNDIAKSMAATTDWRTYSLAGSVGNDRASNNTSGFTGLPAGSRSSNGRFNNIGNYARWWSSTESSNGKAWFRGFYYNSINVARSYDITTNGSTVRCIMDN